MFRKLRQKIYLPIILIVAALILFVDIFGITLQAYTLNNAYHNMGEKRVARSLDSLQLYISSAAAFTYNLSLDTDIINKLKYDDARPVSERLNTACNYSLKMDAVTLYSLNGKVYTSSTVTGTPSLDALQSDTVIHNFIASKASAVVSMRTSNVSDIYYNVLYPDNKGVVSLGQKVYDGNEVIGIIFTDILSANLYEYIFSEGQFNNATAFISAGDSIFDYNDNTDKQELLKSGSNNCFKYTATADDGLFTVTVFESKSEYNREITDLVLIMSATSIVLTAAVIVIARRTASSVTGRIEALNDKMNAQTLFDSETQNKE